MSKASFKMTATLSAVALSMAATVVLAGPAKAEELWDPYLRGVFEGQAAGALPPPGVYGELDNYWTSYGNYLNNNGTKEPGHLSALVEVPIVLWVPGIKILGADYAAAIGQPIDFTRTKLFGHTGGGNWGTYNTILVPGMLSWALPDHVFVRTGLTVLLDDASSTMGDVYKGKLTNGGAPSGNAYTTIQPDFGVSWLYDGWNLSVGTHYAIPVSGNKSNGINYRSAAQFSADYTVTKTIGAWTAGIGGEQENQFSRDTVTVNGVSVPGRQTSNYGVGPILGYQFANGVGVMGYWNHSFATKSDVAGDFFNLRLTAAF
ncbi:phenol degradation protein [Acidocella aquatica]|uniref:Phenol degradation protein n=1 Tax=Acidocella aquatica TaxID=1922313 RepID=A0ABQ6AFJ5_9PROT|nr:transporter [Acidocella aquatica]GLR68988.1 phenol degradation protein [Acidocella aquatica]